MHNAAFVVATLAVLVTGLLVAVRLRLPSRLDALLAWGVLCIGEVLALMLFFGWIGALRTGWLLLGSVVVLAVVGITARGPTFAEARREARTKVRVFRTDLAWTNLRAVPLAVFLALLATAQVAWSAFAGWALPPNGYDTFWYHGPAVAYWVQQGKIVRTPYSFLTNVYPLNADLTFAWPAAILRSDALVNLGQVPFALLGAAAAGVIARTIGVRRSGAVVAASLYLLAPVVAQQMAVPYVDLALAGSFLVAFAFLLRATQSLGLLRGASPSQRSPRLVVCYAALAGVAGGIGAGSKASGLAYLGVLAVLAVAALVAAVVRGTLRPAGALRLVVVLAVPVLLLGTSWYVRNLVEHQNPLYPWNVEVAGVVVEHGPRGDPNQDVLEAQAPAKIADDSAPVQLARSWISEPLRNYNYDTRLGGSGLLWIIAAVPALVFFTIRCIRRRRDILFLFLVPSALILLLQPANWWSRFTVFFLGVGFVALGSELGRLRAWRPKVSRVVEVAIAVIALATFGLVNHRLATAGPKAVLDHATESIDSRSAAASLETNGEFRWLSRIPPTATIATRLVEAQHQNPGGPTSGFVYPLFGRHFERDVVILQGRDEAGLLRQLRKAPHVQYVLAEAGKPLDRALQSAPDEYTLVARQGSQRIYRVGTS
jgi:hypothetical protein